MTIKKLLDEISVIPGVAGSCVFDRTDGPLCTNSEATLSRDILLKVGSYLMRMLKMGEMNDIDITGSNYRFDTCSVVSTPLGSDAILLTICDNQANCSLVATTAAMLAADMKEQLVKGGVSESVIIEKQQEIALDAEAEEKAPPDSRLQEYFDKIEEELAFAIGPVAGMIMQDYIVKWQQNGPAEAERLPELITILSAEISDNTLITEFRERTKKLLR